jgi:hypothetical protein
MGFGKTCILWEYDMSDQKRIQKTSCAKERRMGKLLFFGVSETCPK